MINMLRGRRSIRKYTSQPVDRPTLDLLLEAALRAPSSRNNKPWKFVVVDDPELLATLSTAKTHGSAFLRHAPLGIVVCADSTKSDVWIEDCAIAAILIQMEAQSLGLGSCWIQIRTRPHSESVTAESFIQEHLGLPEQIKVASIISIGYADEIKTPVPAKNLDYQVVSYNLYTA
jgi:nitroreductase